MKKRVLALLLSAMTVITMVGCGEKDGSVEGTEVVESTESTESKVSELPAVDLAKYDYNVDELVTLCDYEGIPLTVTGDYEVTDQDVQDYFEQMFTNYGPFYKDDDSKTTIEEGDIVKVDYVGKLDGEAFEGGSAEDQLIDVTNNSSADGTTYIDGFTAGLMGHSVGEEIDCDVTFPEEYQNADLAGKDVVFTFTIKAIQREITLEEVDDAFAKEQFQAETTEEMYAQLRTFLEQTAEKTKADDTYTALQSYLLENCTVEVPEEFVEDKLTAFKNSFITAYCGGDASQYETTISTYYGYTVEEAEEMWKEGLTQDTKIEFIMRAVAEKEGMEFDQEGFDAYMQNIVSYNGATSVEQVYENYGYGDTAYGEQYMKNIYLANIAMDVLKEKANVTIEAPVAEEAADATEEVVSTETETETDAE